MLKTIITLCAIFVLFYSVAYGTEPGPLSKEDLRIGPLKVKNKYDKKLAVKHLGELLNTTPLGLEGTPVKKMTFKNGVIFVRGDLIWSVSIKSPVTLSTSRGLKIGDSVTKLTKLYGKSQSIETSKNNKIYCFTKENIGVFVTANTKNEVTAIEVFTQIPGLNC